ncbi:MAG: dihydrofolate reductase family protein, partial [Paracoccaceae bacterium]|nr:dihydrofolate reductase family protein [Paracoccaceae bacterium]
NCPANNGRVNLQEALRQLAATGLTRILCEGGAHLAAALIQDGLVDELAHFGAGTLIGGEGHPALGPLHLVNLAAAPRLRHLATDTIGPDTLSRWSFA